MRDARRETRDAGRKTEDDACSATKQIPSLTKEHAWKTRAIACEATTDNNACGSKSSYCVAKPGPEWLACVYQKGVHTIDVCPDNYRNSVRTLYPDEPLDDRGCNECTSCDYVLLWEAGRRRGVSG